MVGISRDVGLVELRLGYGDTLYSAADSRWLGERLAKHANRQLHTTCFSTDVHTHAGSTSYNEGHIPRKLFQPVTSPYQNVTGKSPLCYGEVSEKLRTCHQQVSDVTESYRLNCSRGIWPLS